MRISLYSESPDPGPGGAEQFIVVLAEALSRAHEVTIVHHKPASIATALAEYSGCDLSRVKFRHVAMEVDESSKLLAPFARYRAAKAWRREVTSECDIFLGLFHNKPPFCRARKGAMVVLFPTYEIPAAPEKRTPAKPKKKKRGQKKQRESIFASPIFQRWYTRFEWKRRMASYPIKLAISDFSRKWTRKRWVINCELLYPPVAMSRVEGGTKRNRILSVGRFATTGHTKKQLELINAFADLRDELPDWSYASVGGLNEMPHDHAYFETVRKLGEENGIEVAANISHEKLTELYRESRIFWHAAGLGDDHETQPQQAEHFGLTTVEAMAHGCVPLVINHGGQPEIVQHGVSGFVWNSLLELQDYTRRLARDPELLATMSSAARMRAETFSRERCVDRLLKFVSLA